MAHDRKKQAQAAPDITVIVQPPANEPVPPKPNRFKDIWLPIICAFLGFAFGVTGEIIKQEYQYRASIPHVRFSEGADNQIKSPSGFSRVFFTKIHRVGRLSVPVKILAARSSRSVQITDGFVQTDPPSALTNFTEVETPGHESETRTLDIPDIPQGQSITWRITVESANEIPGDGVSFSYSGPPNLVVSDEKQSWTEHLNISIWAIALLSYSVAVTIVAFRWHQKLRQQANDGKKEQGEKS